VSVSVTSIAGSAIVNAARLRRPALSSTTSVPGIETSSEPTIASISA
jgi:hypothetical protein